ncbi:MAG TPA: cyclic nucleotide-binding domain-containing protein [Anaerolineales bacterium]|nr:cyclic nucleotide-binding domain-containing protein [Anaerolineales bacterium]
MNASGLGKVYGDGEIIFRQGDSGDCMYVIQEGKVEVFLEQEGKEVSLKLCREGEFLGEMALFYREPHPASARVLGNARVLTVEKKNFLRRIQEDPTIAFRLVQTLSQRIKELGEEVAVLNRVVQECLDEQLRSHGSPS